jgi:hypothetical protein
MLLQAYLFSCLAELSANSVPMRQTVASAEVVAGFALVRVAS